MSCLTVGVTHGSQQSQASKPSRSPSYLEPLPPQQNTITSRLAVHERKRRDVGHTFSLQRITRCFALGHIHNPMDIEADLLRARRPSFIAETIQVLAIVARVERMVAGGDGFLVDYVLVRWADDLDSTERRVSDCCLESTHKSAVRKPVAVQWERVHRAPDALASLGPG